MINKQNMPREEGLDHSLSLMREGYMYILNRRRSFHSDVFETRLLGKKAICMGEKRQRKFFMTPRNSKGKALHLTGRSKPCLVRMVFKH